MSLFNLFKSHDINDGVKQMRSTPGAVLLDVRTREEYVQTHIPGGINMPLDTLEMAEQEIANKDTPIFVYCLSGGRSAQAEHILRHLGYTNVTNLGGIREYNPAKDISHP